MERGLSNLQGFSEVTSSVFSASSLWSKECSWNTKCHNETEIHRSSWDACGKCSQFQEISPPFWTLPIFVIFIYSAFLQDLFCYHSSPKWLNTSLVRKSFGITTGTRHANDSFTVLPAVTSDGNHWNRHCDCKSKTCCLKWWCPPCSSSYLEDLVSESSQTKHSLESTTEMHQIYTIYIHLSHLV